MNTPAAVVEGPGPIPEEAFDSFAVYSALTPQARQRTGPENVADTLDALVRLIRNRPAPPTPDTAL